MPRIKPVTGKLADISRDAFRGKQKAANLPKVPPSAPWLYKHHPERWDVLGDKVRPVLATLKTIPGINNVTADGDIGPALLDAEKKGWTILTAELVGESYVQEIEVAKGTAHLSIWQSAFPGSERTRVDNDGYRAFLDSIVERGVIRPPQIEVLEARAEEYRSRAERYERNGSPAALNKASEFRRRLDILEKAVADALASLQPVKAKPAALPKPKTTRKRATKKTAEAGEA